MAAVPTNGVGEFCARLRQLWVESGEPPLKSLEASCGVSDSQLSAILNGKVKRPPAWSIVSALVIACADHAKRHRRFPSLTSDQGFWRERHAALERPVPSRPAARPNPPRDTWAALAEDHVVWDRVVDPDRVRSQVVAVAERLSEHYAAAARTCAGDPWLDPAFVERMTSRVSGLIAVGLSGDELRFSAVEAALLVLAPMLHEVQSARSAAEMIHVAPTLLGVEPEPDADRAQFQRYLSGQQQRRLVARTEHRDALDRGGVSVQIGWWLFHRWIDSRSGRPEGAATKVVLHDMPIQDRALSKVLVTTLDRLVRLFRLSPDDLRNPDRLGLVASASHLGVSVSQQVVRERLIGLLLGVAHALAIETTTLPATLAEHLGIPEPVNLEQLRTTLDEAEWAPVTIGLGLVAECHHEAVLEALREHVARTDVVLGAVHAAADNDVTLQPLLRLPARASADRVEPALRPDGKPVFAVPVARFRLDETRVRELLMGEQLYGDRSIAIRELYQNALDACRYRQARHEFRAESGWRSDWSGSIEFDQGIDENGRHYLRCADNGIGMGESELREVFSQAGIRFADRPEFIEEQAEWAERGIRLYPNSRFGIGVMSYFMLADEIEVTTCRMSRHGDSPGALLKVAIAGPGHLFRIKHLADRGDRPGTEVKLYLRQGEDAPSCVEVLQRLLAITDFTTRAEHEGLVAEWAPQRFHARSRRPGETDGIEASGRLVPARPADNGQVIWCERGGALLADGLYVRPADRGGVLTTLDDSSDIRGAVVNLTKQWTPRLTVDRQWVLDDVSDHVEELLVGAVPDLLEEQDRTPLLSFDWLREVAGTSTRVADVITAVGARLEHRIEFKGRLIDLAVTGCFPADSFLVDNESEKEGHGDWDRRLPRNMPDHLVLWRLLAHRPDLVPDVVGKAAPQILPARPSDAVLVGLGASAASDYGRVSPGYVVAKAAALGFTPRAAASRMAALGYEVDPGRFPDRPALPIDALLLSNGLDGQALWLDESAAVPLGHLIAAQVRTKVPASEVLRRLAIYSFKVDQLSGTAQRFSEADLTLVSKELNAQSPWLRPDSPVAKQHVYLAAHVLGWSLPAVTSRLEVLGFEVPAIDGLVDWSAELPQAAAEVLKADFSRSRDGVPLISIVMLAVFWGIQPSEVVDKLADLGHFPEIGVEFPDRLDDFDVMLVTSVVKSPADTGYTRTASIETVVHLASKLGSTPAAVATRLQELGFEVPPRRAVERDFDEVDLHLLGGQLRRHFVSWQRMNAPMYLHELVGRLRGTTITMPEAIARLESMGIAAPELSWLPEHASELDYILFRQDLGVIATFAARGGVPVAHLLVAVRASGHRVQDAMKRMEELRIPVLPHGYDVAGAAHDLSLMRRFDWMVWFGSDEQVQIRQLIGKALTHSLPVTEVAKRLAAVGLTVADVATELPGLLARVPTAP